MPSTVPPPLITLTTDFGLADHYVGTMKGVLLSRCQGVILADISHEIAPFSIYAGAYAIDQAAPYFPPGTVHLVVIDPGVGTSRRGVVAETIEQIFVAPDNGVLSLLLSGHPKARIREIANRKLWLESPSSTFHGRDIFAPVAAALAGRSVSLEEVGPLCDSVQRLPDLYPEESGPDLWSGRVLSTDRFGNVITNFSAAQFADVRFEITAGSHQITEFRTTFGQAPANLCFAYVGSSAYIELAMNQQSAAKYLKIQAGDAVYLRRRAE